MLVVIGEALPFAVAIAFSPLGIVSVVVMLLSSYPRASSISFVAGWMAGIAVVAGAGFFFAGLVPDLSGASRFVTPVVLIVAGLASMVFAVRQWLGRPGPDDIVDLPGWMSRIDGLTALRSFVFGAVLAATKPKNIVLAFGTGVGVEAAGLRGAEALIVLAVYLVVASLSIAAPVIAYLIAGDSIAPRLERLREWMIRNNSAMLGVILLFIGVVLVGNGLAGF